VRPSSTARRYAEAAFDVAQEDGAVARWLQDLRAANDVLQEPDMARYFRDPSVSTEDKLQALDRLTADLRPRVLNLLRLLVARRRLHLLPQIVRELESLDREARGILEATATVARDISGPEKDEIARRLSEITGKDVHVGTEVDPSILGGIVVRIGDYLIDASVEGRLERLRQEMAIS
jgi:F-type H+-transporting ATPase subunit delta